jgi:hypothetical protein
MPAFFNQRQRAQATDGITKLTLQAILCVPKTKSERIDMKSAQDVLRTYGAGSLNRTIHRRTLVQGPMRSNAVIIGCSVFQTRRDTG